MLSAVHRPDGGQPDRATQDSTRWLSGKRIGTRQPSTAANQRDAYPDEPAGYPDSSLNNFTMRGIMMLKRLVFLSILAVAIIPTLFGAVAQAQPVAVNGTNIATMAEVVPQAVQDCPSGYACLWTSPGWSGRRWQGTNRNDTLPSFIDNNSLSSANHSTSRVACFWTDQYGRGQALREGPGSIRQNLSLDPRAGGGNWGRIISSLTWNC
jgi:peptidase inhibitor family I36